ncbi:hypothetical protein GGX14DRAFT_541344 [Mycena pura]|uniref:Uncharacterized protein n=1 Tax=Mycena pura TaxID=153505 RepID=A0AAD6VR50_9AGAR|nr:hypothetical protein GGX14DRAFT_541344 [Mycena pura]
MSQPSLAAVNYIGLILMTLFYGIYFVLFVMSMYLLLWQGSINKGRGQASYVPILRSMVFISGVALFIVVTGVRAVFLRLHLLAAMILTRCAILDQPSAIAGGVFLALSLILGDAMIVYRLWVVWDHNKLVIIIPLNVFPVSAGFIVEADIHESPSQVTELTALTAFTMAWDQCLLYNAWVIYYAITHELGLDIQYIAISAFPTVVGIANALIHVRIAMGNTRHGTGPASTIHFYQPPSRVRGASSEADDSITLENMTTLEEDASMGKHCNPSMSMDEWQFRFYIGFYRYHRQRESGWLTAGIDICDSSAGHAEISRLIDGTESLVGTANARGSRWRRQSALNQRSASALNRRAEQLTSHQTGILPLYFIALMSVLLEPIYISPTSFTANLIQSSGVSHNRQTPQNIAALLYLGARMSQPSLSAVDFIGLILMTMFYGIYFVLFVISMYLLLQQGSINKVRGQANYVPILRSMVFISGVALFIVVTGDWAETVFRNAQALVYFKESYLTSNAQPSAIAAGVFLALSLILGDSMIVYRLWVVWHYNKLVMIIPLDVFPVSAGFIVEGDIHQSPNQVTALTAFTAFTMATNIYCTIFISWAIWRVTSNSSPIGGANLRHFLAVVVESAALYTAWVIYYTITHELGLNIQYIAISTFPTVVGIANALIHVRIAMGKTIEQRPGTGPASAIHFKQPPSRIRTGALSQAGDSITLENMTTLAKEDASMGKVMSVV